MYRSQHKIASKYLKSTNFILISTIKWLGVNLTLICGFSKTVFFRDKVKSCFLLLRTNFFSENIEIPEVVQKI